MNMLRNKARVGNLLSKRFVCIIYVKSSPAGCLHAYDNCVGGLKGRAVSVADTVTFPLDLVTFGAAASGYFHC